MASAVDVASVNVVGYTAGSAAAALIALTALATTAMGTVTSLHKLYTQATVARQRGVLSNTKIHKKHLCFPGRVSQLWLPRFH